MLSLSWYSLLAAWRAGDMPLDRLAYFAAEAGYDAIELLDAFLYPVGAVRDYALGDEEFAACIALLSPALKETGIKVSSVAVTNDFNIDDAGRLAAEKGKVRFGQRLAKELGASVVRVFAGNPTDTHGIEMVRYRTIDAFKQLQREEAVLALENHGPTFNIPYRLNSILDSLNSQNVGVCFDIGNFTLADYDSVGAAKELANIKLIHVKDFVRDDAGPYMSKSQKKFAGCRLGDGIVQIEETLALLNSAEVPVVVELECGEDGLEASRHAAQYLRSKLV